MKNSTKNKIPERICIVSRKKYPRNELIRFIKKDSILYLDLDFKIQARGYYVLNDKSILKQDKILKRICKITRSNNISQEVIDFFESL